MEILIFEDKRWDEIPNQDNPAFDYLYENNRLKEGFKGRRRECILVSRVMKYRSHAVGENGFSVIEIPLNGDVIAKGIFWDLESAKIFANALSNLKS